MATEGKKKGLKTFTSSTTINKPIQEVFDATSTPRFWELCYPATVGVGGITSRPFKPGNIVQEKFMWGGFLYAVFNYKVGEYEPPKKFSFGGKQVFTNTFVQSLFGSLLAKTDAEIAYTLEEVDGGTKWTRHSKYWYTGGPLTAIFFHLFILIMKPSLKHGAKLYMETSKALLEQDGFPD